MLIPDLNVLVHSVNSDDRNFEASAEWVSSAMNGAETIGLAWVVLVGFVRLTTSRRVLRAPLDSSEAVDMVRSWQSRSCTVLVEPTARHLDLLQGLLAETGTGGNLVNDAHIAVLALEHAATVITYDTDFERFGVPWERPGR